MRLFRSFAVGSHIAWASLWANKLRAGLTTFGIVIGIVSVTTMSTLIDGVDRGFERSLSMLGTHVLYVQKWPWSFGPDYNWWDYINRKDMELAYAERLEELSTTASAVSASMYATELIKFESQSVSDANLRGTTPQYMRTAAVETDRGRFFTEDEYRSGRNVALLGTSIAETLFGDREPIGRSVRIGGLQYDVIGVLAKQGSFMGMESFDKQVIIPATSFGRQYGFRRFVQLQIKFESEALLNEGVHEIEGLMRRIRRLDPAAPSDFSINRLDMFREQYQALTGAIYGIGIFLTALSLFVGGIGVMNIMFVSVKERTREIGIRKAIGARNSEILLQFLIEAVVICLVGGLIGTVLSIGTSALVNQFFVAYMDWSTVMTAFVICTLTGVAFGFFPAWKAAQSDPIESLRYE
jgi:putative ABC transport system permease protein